jgi:hypothetical protein
VHRAAALMRTADASTSQIAERSVQ